MESELAKTLRAMSDDHRMVPDFSEQLLDIADAIERQAKELKAVRDQNEVLRDHLALANGEVERLKGQVAELRGGFDAEQAGIELRRRQDAMGR